MKLTPTRTTLYVEAPPQGISGVDALRALAYGLRSLGSRLTTVGVYEAAYAPEAGLSHHILPRRGTGTHHLDLFIAPWNSPKERRRGEVVHAASTAAARMLGSDEATALILGRADLVSLDTVWPLLSDIPVKDLPDVGGKAVAGMFESWLETKGMRGAKLLDLESKLRIGRAVGSRIRTGKVCLASVHGWAKRAGYKGDLTDFTEEFWP